MLKTKTSDVITANILKYIYCIMYNELRTWQKLTHNQQLKAKPIVIGFKIQRKTSGNLFYKLEKYGHIVIF